jgi:hypothetical protein
MCQECPLDQFCNEGKCGSPVSTQPYRLVVVSAKIVDKPERWDGQSDPLPDGQVVVYLSVDDIKAQTDEWSSSLEPRWNQILFDKLSLGQLTNQKISVTLWDTDFGCIGPFCDGSDVIAKWDMQFTDRMVKQRMVTLTSVNAQLTLAFY